MSQFKEKYKMKKHILATFIICIVSIPIYSQTKKIYFNSFYSEFIFHDGLLAIKDKDIDKWGFLDTKGNTKIPFVWECEGTPGFGGGVCALFKRVGGKKKWFILDTEGKEKLLPNIISVSRFNEDGYAYAVTSAHATIIINSKGVEVFRAIPKYRTVASFTGTSIKIPPTFHNGLAIFEQNGKCGYFNEQGRIVIPAKYSRGLDFSDGLAAVQTYKTETTPSKWGYIDTLGNMVIPAIYTSEPDSFHDGYAVVKKSNLLYIYINKKGETVSEELEIASRFFNGYAFMREKPGFYEGARKPYIIDKNMKVVSDTEEAFRNPFVTHDGSSFSSINDLVQYQGDYILVRITGGHITKQHKVINSKGLPVHYPTGVRYDDYDDGFPTNLTVLASDDIVVQYNHDYNNFFYGFIDIKSSTYNFTIERSQF